MPLEQLLGIKQSAAIGKKLQTVADIGTDDKLLGREKRGAGRKNIRKNALRSRK